MPKGTTQDYKLHTFPTLNHIIILQKSPKKTRRERKKQNKKPKQMAGKRSMLRLKKFIVKLTRCMQVLQKITPVPSEDDRSALVPEGHFAVLAGMGDEEEQKRFVVELKFLRSPPMLRLLKEAEEEYGFDQEGALVVPCSPIDLQRIILEGKNKM